MVRTGTIVVEIYCLGIAIALIFSAAAEHAESHGLARNSHVAHSVADQVDKFRENSPLRWSSLAAVLRTTFSGYFLFRSRLAFVS